MTNTYSNTVHLCSVFMQHQSRAKSSLYIGTLAHTSKNDIYFTSQKTHRTSHITDALREEKTGISRKNR